MTLEEKKELADFIRKDMKNIVADAVRDALDNGRNEWIKPTKHPISSDGLIFNSTRQFLDSYGARYFEDINGYTSGDLNKGIVPMIRIGDNENSALWPIPFDNFEDLEKTMNGLGLPFTEI